MYCPPRAVHQRTTHVFRRKGREDEEGKRQQQHIMIARLVALAVLVAMSSAETIEVEALEDEKQAVLSPHQSIATFKAAAKRAAGREHDGIGRGAKKSELSEIPSRFDQDLELKTHRYVHAAMGECDWCAVWAGGGGSLGLRTLFSNTLCTYTPSHSPRCPPPRTHSEKSADEAATASSVLLSTIEEFGGKAMKAMKAKIQAMKARKRRSSVGRARTRPGSATGTARAVRFTSVGAEPCEFGKVTEKGAGTAVKGTCCPGDAKRKSGQATCKNNHPQMYGHTRHICWTEEGNNWGYCTEPDTEEYKAKAKKAAELRQQQLANRTINHYRRMAWMDKPGAPKANIEIFVGRSITSHPMGRSDSNVKKFGCRNCKSCKVHVQDTKALASKAVTVGKSTNNRKSVSCQKCSRCKDIKDHNHKDTWRFEYSDTEVTAIRSDDPSAGWGHNLKVVCNGLAGMVVALKGGKNHKYCSDEGKSGQIKCNSDSVGASEKFVVVDAGRGKIALRGGKDKKICADEGSRIKCNRDGIGGGWEKFTVQMLGGGKLALRGSKDNKFCSDEGNSIKCNRGGVGGWEMFTLELQPKAEEFTVHMPLTNGNDEHHGSIQRICDGDKTKDEQDPKCGWEQSGLTVTCVRDVKSFTCENCKSCEITNEGRGETFNISLPTHNAVSGTNGTTATIRRTGCDKPGCGWEQDLKLSCSSGMGAQCQCPDGSISWVGDHNDNCKSVGCEGGTMLGKCGPAIPSKSYGYNMTCALATPAQAEAMKKASDLAEKIAAEDADFDDDLMPENAKNMDEGASESESVATETETEASIQSKEADDGKANRLTQDADRDPGNADGVGGGGPGVFLEKNSLATGLATGNKVSATRLRHARACAHNTRVQATLQTTLLDLESLSDEIPIGSFDPTDFLENHKGAFVEEEEGEEDGEGEEGGEHHHEHAGTDTSRGLWEGRIKALERTVALQREEIASIHVSLAQAFRGSPHPVKRSTGELLEVDSQNKASASRDLSQSYRTKSGHLGPFKKVRAKVVEYLRNLWNKIKDGMIKPLWQLIKEKIVNPIKNIFKPIIDWVKGIWNKMMTAFKSLTKVWDFVKKVISWFKSIPKMIQQMIAKVVRKIETVADKVIAIGKEWVNNAKAKAENACGFMKQKRILFAMCKYPMIVMFMTIFKIQDMIASGIDMILNKLKEKVYEKLNYNLGLGSKEQSQKACMFVRILFLPIVPANLAAYTVCILFQRFMELAVSMLDLLFAGITKGTGKLKFLAPGLDFKTMEAADSTCAWYIKMSRMLPIAGLIKMACHLFVRLIWGIQNLLVRCFNLLNEKIIRGFMGITNLGIDKFFYDTETCTYIKNGGGFPNLGAVLAPLAVACEFAVPVGLNGIRFVEWATKTLMDTLDGNGQVADRLVELVAEGLKAGSDKIKSMMGKSSFLEVGEESGASQESYMGFDVMSFLGGSDKPWVKPFAEIAQAAAKFQSLSWKTVLEDAPPKALNRAMHFVRSCNEDGKECTTEVDSTLSLPGDTGASTCSDVQYTCTPKSGHGTAPTPAECKQLRDGEELDSHKITDYAITSQCVIDPEMSTPDDDLSAMGGSTCAVVEISSDTLMLGVINQVQKLAAMLKSAMSRKKSSFLELQAGHDLKAFVELKAEQAGMAESISKFLCKARASMRTKLGPPTIIRATICNLQQNKPWKLQHWDDGYNPTTNRTSSAWDSLFRAQLEVFDQGQLVFSSVYDDGFVVDLAKRQGSGLFERLARLQQMPKIISEALSNSWRVSLKQEDAGWKLSVEMPTVIAAIKSITGGALDKLESLFGAGLKFGIAVAPKGESELFGISLRHLYQRLGIADKVGMVISKVGAKAGEVVSKAAAGPLAGVISIIETGVTMVKDGIAKGKRFVSRVQEKGEAVVDKMLDGLKNAVISPIINLLTKFETVLKKVNVAKDKMLKKVNDIKDKVNATYNAAKDKVLDIKAQVNSVASDDELAELVELFSQLADTASEGELSKTMKKVNAGYNAAKDQANATFNAAKDKVNEITDKVNAAKDRAKQAAALGTAKFVTGVVTFIEKVEHGVEAMVKRVVDAIDAMGGKASSAVTFLGSKVVDMQKVLDKIPDKVKTMAPFKMPNLNSTVQKVGGLRITIKSFVEKTHATFAAATEKFKHAAEEAKSKVKEALLNSTENTPDASSILDSADIMLGIIATIKVKILGAYNDTVASANGFKLNVTATRKELEGRLDAAIAPAEPILKDMNKFLDLISDPAALGEVIAAKLKSALYGVATKQMRKLWFMKDSLPEVWKGFSPSSAAAVCPVGGGKG
jgi:hypothetical protein